MHKIIILIKQIIITYYNKFIDSLQNANFPIIIGIKEKFNNYRANFYNKWQNSSFLVVYNKHKNLLIISIICSIIVCTIILNQVIQHFFKFKTNKFQTHTVVVKVESARKKNLPIKIYATGRVTPITSITVVPQTEGIIMSAKFNEGELVEEGQLLFEMDPRIPQSEYEQAQANLKKANADLQNAKLQLKRSGLLYSKKIISPQSHDQTVNLFATAKANELAAISKLNASKVKLDFTKIYAPITGITGELLTTPGTVVKSNSQKGLVNINQLDPIYIIFSIPETYISELIKNISDLNQLTVTIPDLNKKGKLVFINNHIDELNGTILLKAEFCNFDLSLWPGQFVNLDLIINTIYDATVIPSIAVQTGQTNSYVYVAESLAQIQVFPNRPKLAEIKKVFVETGATTDQQTVITKGLTPGDLVVTEGYSNLINQNLVEIIYVP